MSKAINKERKQIIQQVVILALFCIIVIIGGRILSGNRFKMTIAMADWNAAETAEDIQISWENDRAMKVSELSVRDGKDLVLVLEPDGPGDYELNIAGKDGRTILYDELHVDPLGTTYSMQSRNFTLRSIHFPRRMAKQPHLKKSWTLPPFPLTPINLPRISPGRFGRIH